jgi:SPP1 gp7 family putative phage head morphogenesis protein
MAFNHDVFDRFTSRAVDLEKFTAGQRQKALRLLKQMERDLVLELAKADLPGYTITAYKQQRLAALLTSTRATIQSAYVKMRAATEGDWQRLAKAEGEFVRRSINTLAGVELASVSLNPEQLKAVISDVLIQGAPSKEWWKRQTASTTNKFADTVRHGVLQGQTNDEIARAVRQNVTGVAAGNVEILVRTSVQTITQAARLESFASNDDVIEGLQQHSTLDSRTTPICMAYSGAVWTNDEKHDPIDGAPPFVNPGGAITGIPRHWGCRSYFVPVIKSWQKLTNLQTGGRPADTADSYFQKRLLEQGLSEKEAARAIAGAQASMDGQVAQSMTYEQWLKTKPESFQKAVLGPGKFDLWKKGKITLADLIDQSGHPMTLAQLESAA